MHTVGVGTADGEAVELLQRLIRNACVNEGTAESGFETRSVDTLSQVLDGHGIHLERYAPQGLPHRASLIGRLEGRRPAGRTVALVAHTDVVPAESSAWQHDPFGGDYVDGEVWGRGAVDMLGQTTAMALAFNRLARSGWRPPYGTAVFMALADEEAGSEYGCQWLFDNHPEVMRADVVFTELGGIQLGRYVTVGTEEKGWASIDIVIYGTSGHGSTPWGSDNAIQKAAVVVNKLPHLHLHTSTSLAWKAWTLSDAAPFLNRHPTQLGSQFIGDQSDFPSWVAALENAANSTTVSANQIEGGLRRNMIPDRVILRLDVRLVADDTATRVRDEICALLEDDLHYVEVNINGSWDATSSEIDSFAWPVMRQVVLDLVGRELLPTPVTAATDARFFRRNGIPAYGLGLMSQGMDYASYWSRFHGIDERIDVKSIDLSISLWEQLLKRLLSDPPEYLE